MRKILFIITLLIALVLAACAPPTTTHHAAGPISMNELDAQATANAAKVAIQSTSNAVKYSAESTAVAISEHANGLQAQVGALSAENEQLRQQNALLDTEFATVQALQTSDAINLQVTQVAIQANIDMMTTQAQATVANEQLQKKVYADRLAAQERQQQIRKNVVWSVAAILVVVVCVLAAVLGLYLDTRKPSQITINDQKFLVVPNGDGRWRVMDPSDNTPKFQPVASVNRIGTQPHVVDAEMGSILDDVNVIKYLLRFNRLLIAGVSGTGKTSLVLHLVSQMGDVIALDPKPRTPWPNNVRVFTKTGSNYGAIKKQLAALVELMNRREGQMKKDHSYDPTRLHVVVDDWPRIVNAIDTARSDILTLVNDARESNIHVILCSQSTDVTTLGIKGQGALRNSFTVVKLEIDLDQQRTVTVINGDEQREFDHCGPYDGASSPNIIDQVVGDSYATGESTTDHIDALVLQNHSNVDSLRALERAVYGNNAGGTQFYALKQSLERLGLTRPVKRTTVSRAN